MKYINNSFASLLFLFFLLVLSDNLLGNFCQYSYNTSKYGILARQIYCMTDMKEDIIILGSSRAAHHYVPSILSDSLNMSCYNAGSDGMCIYYHYTILASCIKKHRPKLVIYDVSDLDLLASKSSSFTLEAALERLSPYYNSYTEVDSLFLLKGWRQTLKMKSMMYRYNSKLVQLIKCHFIPSYEDNGYEAIYGKLADGIELNVEQCRDMDFEENKKKYLKKLIQLTKKEDITLLFVHSPHYIMKKSVAMEEIKEIAKESQVPFIDMSNITELMCPKYFRDKSHLNDEGAKIYSNILGHRLKKML